MSSELLVSRGAAGTWAALREDGVVAEIRFERDGRPLGVGRIVKAKVSKVLPGIQSAFLDVGQERDGFLHVADLVLPEDEPVTSAADPDAIDGGGDDEADEDLGAWRREVRRAAPIQDRLAAGRELVVQVAREAIGAKGARVTCFVALPGRYLVYLPRWGYRAVSRRIEDPEERQRLKEIIARLPVDVGGFIVRTAARGAPAEAFEADAAMLVATWRAIVDEAERSAAPALLHADVDLLERLLRDAPRGGLDAVVVDDAKAFDRAHRYLSALDPSLAARVRLHEGAEPLFEAEGIAAEIDRALRPKVWLRSGGSIVIQQTEALVSIDVNTGKFVGKRTPEETILKTNLEAAEEIARQLRLRDLGGIIVVDFIDMERPESRRRVLETLDEALRRDRARTKVVGLSELGLVQLTRKRTRPALEATVTEPCPCCAGGGRVKSPFVVAGEAIEEVRRLRRVFRDERFTVRVHPEVGRALRLAMQSGGVPTDASWFEAVSIEDAAESRLDQFDVLAR